MTTLSLSEHLEYPTRRVSVVDEVPENENDIYRGEPSNAIPNIVIDRAESIAGTEASSTSSSSSSSWSGLGLRKGALGAILELAINRWARATSGSSSQSSISSASSINTRSRRRSRRRPSLSTSINTHSEHIIRARLQARGIGRTVPREFLLFLPPALVTSHSDKRISAINGQRVFRSTSLPLVLTRLDATIKRLAKLRKPARLRSLSPAASPHDVDLRTSEYTDNGKGKAREGMVMVKVLPPSQPAWWLDVASPSWNDMREIGKLLHLHPLTLEDILHQETREKVEAFPRLGYYFIIFRALESEKTRAKMTQLGLDCGDNVPHFEGIVNATNIYIIVFRDGICTFHFEDISEHTSRVQNRIIQLEQTFRMSSDWIAHGLLDSIVDQFFPVLDRIDREVKDLDDLISPVTSSNATPDTQAQTTSAPALEATPQDDNSLEKGPGQSEVEVSVKKEESPTSSLDSVVKAKNVYMTPLTLIRHMFPILKSIISRLRAMLRSQSKSKKGTIQRTPLMRMAATRRLVTSLSRLLGTKSEVLSQLKKRLAIHPHGPTSQTIMDVGIYLDDIQDHIFTLHQSLAHNEHILSHSHPAYISHLRVKDAQARSGTDKGIMALTLISIAAGAMQVPTGAVSINVGKLPGNRRTSNPGQSPAPFNGFLVIVAIVLLLAAGIVGLTRYWWLQAKKKYAQKLT